MYCAPDLPCQLLRIHALTQISAHLLPTQTCVMLNGSRKSFQHCTRTHLLALAELDRVVAVRVIVAGNRGLCRCDISQWVTHSD